MWVDAAQIATQRQKLWASKMQSAHSPERNVDREYKAWIDKWVTEQIRICQENKTQYFPCDPESKVGISKDFSKNNFPINGLRHPPQGDTNGWYLWSGENLSDADDFFSPSHAKHLLELCPQVTKLFGLPPGYRFLIAPDHVDIWFDVSLLEI